MSLAKYVDGKAEMKFGCTWIRHNDKLVYVYSVKDREVKKNNSYLHDFHTYEWPGGVGLHMNQLFATNNKNTYDDEDFQEMWESSQCFPREGTYNIYHPITGEFQSANSYRYDPENGGAKYKRAALSSAYVRIMEKHGRGSFSIALKEIQDKSYASDWVQHMVNETGSSSMATKSNVVGLTILNSMYFPRYNFVDWQDPETLLSFFRKERQLILSHVLKAVRIDNCIILFANATPLGIFSERGFMIKETAAALFQKDIEQAGVPYIILKRLVRSQTFMIE
jgi:hypothetical protein